MLGVILVAALGFFFFAMEFVFPSGLLGLASIIFLTTSFMQFISLGVSLEWVMLYLLFFCLLIALTTLIGIFIVRRCFSLRKDQTGFYATTFDGSHVGKIGKAVTDLRPTGYVQIHQKRFQAVSDSGYIVKQTDILVVGGQGGYLIVTKKDEL